MSALDDLICAVQRFDVSAAKRAASRLSPPEQDRFDSILRSKIRYRGIFETQLVSYILYNVRTRLGLPGRN